MCGRPYALRVKTLTLWKTINIWNWKVHFLHTMAVQKYARHFDSKSVFWTEVNQPTLSSRKGQHRGLFLSSAIYTFENVFLKNKRFKVQPFFTLYQFCVWKCIQVQGWFIFSNCTFSLFAPWQYLFQIFRGSICTKNTPAFTVGWFVYPVMMLLHSFPSDCLGPLPPRFIHKLAY